MKPARPLVISCLATALILVIAAGWSGHEQSRLSGAQVRRGKLETEATRLGIASRPTERGQPASASRRRADRAPEAGAGELIKLVREIDGAARKEPPDTDAKLAEFMRLLSQTDGIRIKALLEDILGGPRLAYDVGPAILSLALLKLAEDSPLDACAFFGRAEAHFKEPDTFQALAEQVMATGLSEWAKRDPLAAAEWLEKDGGIHLRYIGETTKRAVVAATATRDPKLAFRLIGELGASDRNDLVFRIARGGAQQADRIPMMEALRDYLTILPQGDRAELRKYGMKGLSFEISQSGFGSGKDFPERAKLTQEEMDLFAAGLAPRAEEIGQWMSWMEGRVSAPVLEKEAMARVVRWMEADYRAAGEWLDGTPPGLLREVSVQAYAQAAAKYDPEAAAEWAMTLEPGKRREETIRNVHAVWPKEEPADAAKAAAFARAHSIR